MDTGWDWSTSGWQKRGLEDSEERNLGTLGAELIGGGPMLWDWPLETFRGTRLGLELVNWEL